MRFTSAIFIGILLSTLSINLFGQSKSDMSDSVARRFQNYALKQSQSQLFLHLDKTIYTQSEQIWFAGYLFNQKRAASFFNTLSVLLVRDDDHHIILQDKFVLANKRSHGNILLPDTISPGDYHLIAYANVLNKNNLPDALYQQGITIKTTDERRFNASLTIDSQSKFADTLNVKLKIKRIDITLLNSANVKCRIGKKTFGIKVDAAGEATIHLPKSVLNSSADHVLYTRIELGGRALNCNLNLPVSKIDVRVKFYPEGGDMAEGIENTVGFEVTTSFGKALDLKGFLYKNDVLLDTIRSGYYGIGKFKLKPEAGNKYYARFIFEGKLLQDSIFYLPKAVADIPCLQIAGAIANETVKGQILSTKTQKVLLLLHNTNNIYTTTSLSLIKDTPVNLRIDLAAIPKGICAITLVDSLYRPLTERLIFAHYNQHDDLNVATDKEQYKTRQKVTLKLKLNDTIANSDIKGILSVACIQESRIATDKQRDIEGYYYLNNTLADIPANPLHRQYNDLPYVENILLVRGWRRYKWRDMISSIQADTGVITNTLKFSGVVTDKYGDRLKWPMSFVEVQDGHMAFIATDKHGNFEIDPRLMVTSPGKRILIFPDGELRYEYIMSFVDPYIEFNKKIAADPGMISHHYQFVANTEVATLKDNQHSRRLKEVLISGKTDELQGAKNECGDYVCKYGVLNCPNHPQGGTLPVIGEKYFYIDEVSRSDKVVYKGCDVFENKKLIAIKGIYRARDFYVSDYKEFNPIGPEYVSTIYWAHSILVDAASPVEVSFYTSDITGSFKIIAQGITNKGLIYKEHLFTVQPGN